MSTTQIVLLVLAVVLALIVLGAVVTVLAKKKARHETEQRRVQASELRDKAETHTPDVRDSQLEARTAAAEADLARARAEQAEVQAAERQRLAAAEEARREDVVREADRLDPDVDHEAQDYRPLAPQQPEAGRGDAEHRGLTDEADTRQDSITDGPDGGAHRA